MARTIPSTDITGILLKQFQEAERQARQHIDRGEYADAARYLRHCHRLMQQYADQPGVGETVRRMRLERAERYLTLALQAESQSRRDDQQPTPLAALPERSASNDYQVTVEALITQANVGWDDIGGLDATKEQIKLNYALGLVQTPPGVRVQPTRRLLFFGPPGTGKTLLAAAISRELDATFFNARIPDLLSQYFGESSKLVSALFAVAAVHAPSVIFLDEIDALGRQRGGSQESGAERRLLNTLLQELDGLHNKGETAPFILTIGATNLPWELDRAVLSRFGGGRIYVPLPDGPARCAILRLYIEQRGYTSQAPAEEWSALTEGFSGREIEQIVGQAVQRMVQRANPDLAALSEAGREALRAYQLRIEPLTRADLEAALTQVRPASGPAQVARYRQWEQEG